MKSDHIHFKDLELPIIKSSNTHIRSKIQKILESQTLKSDHIHFKKCKKNKLLLNNLIIQ